MGNSISFMVGDRKEINLKGNLIFGRQSVYRNLSDFMKIRGFWLYITHEPDNNTDSKTFLAYYLLLFFFQFQSNIEIGNVVTSLHDREITLKTF